MQQYKIKIKAGTGFSLIEVLVSLMIIAIELLGAIALQMNALREGQVSYYRNNATLIAQSVLEQIRSDTEDAGSFSITSAASATTPTQDFKNSVGALLPNGKGQIEVNAANRRVTVSIFWSEDRVRQGTPEQEFTYVSDY